MPPEHGRSRPGQAAPPNATDVESITLREAFDPRLSGRIDRATLQLEACSDDACRRAWRAVLDQLEEMLPTGVGEAVR